jgi:hypothetical protein
MKRTTLIGCLAGLLLVPFHVPNAYAGGVPGTKERISFEGLVDRHSQGGIPGGYDGFAWSGAISAVGKGLYKDQAGFQSVVHRKVAAANLGGAGFFEPETGAFSMHGGHFAAFGNSSVQVTFNAYRRGILVGNKSVILQPTDTLIKFDKSFSHIDKFEIQSGVVAMDELRVSF